MGNSQFELASRLATEFGLRYIRLRGADGLVFEEGEVFKIFIPRSKRILGCGPKDRRVIGELLCVFSKDLKEPTGRSKKFDFDTVIFAAPDANFPSLTLHSVLTPDNPMDDLFRVGLTKLFGALPSTKGGWLEEFGEDFLSAEQRSTRMSKAVVYLRERLEDLGEPFANRAQPLPFDIKIEFG